MALMRTGIRRFRTLSDHLCRSNVKLSPRSYGTSMHKQPLLMPEAAEGNRRTKLLAGTAAIAGATISLGLAAYIYFERPPVKATRGEIQPPRPFKVTVGGPFSLLDQDGKTMTHLDYVGNWCLVYVGYTHCPEDCPKQLQKVAEVAQRFEKAGKEVLPMFMTADPERDTPAQLKQYLREFHPRYVGLTGKPYDVRPVLWKFRAYFRKTEEDGRDYLVEHSSSIYLMNPKMECVRVFGPEYHTESLVEAMEKEMNNFKE